MRGATRISRCPNDDFVTDMDYLRCPNCHTMLKKDEKVSDRRKQEIIDDNAERQHANAHKAINDS